MSNVLAFEPKNQISKVISLNPGLILRDRDLKIAQASNIRNEDIFFPVVQRPLVDLMPVTGDARGHQAIVRRDTNEVIAVHKKRYKLVKNEDVYHHVDRAIRHTEGLDTDGMSITDQVAYAGGRSIRTYTFPNHTIDVPSGETVRDETQLRINVINSYDGSSSLCLQTGGYRLISANGMVIGENLSKYVMRHSSEYKPEEVTPRIAATLKAFIEVGYQWKSWANTRLSPLQVSNILWEFAGQSESKYLTLEAYWLVEQQRMGTTKWALFNALTYWSTHHDVSKGSEANAAAIVLGREQQVVKVINSPVWRAA